MNNYRDRLYILPVAFSLIAFSVLILFTKTVKAESPPTHRKQAVLEEVTVTATRRTESLQDVSIPVSAFSIDRMHTTDITDVKQLQLYEPSVTLGDYFGVPLLNIRGLGLTNIGGIDPSVGLYVDGAVINTPSAQLASVFDLKRIEVLRGPQGTLFGRNTVGGAISLITNKPTDKFEAYVRATAGNYNLLETEGAISGPLVADKLLGRVSWRSTNRGGYGKNQYTGHGVDNADIKSVRGQLQLNLSENMDFLVTGEYSRENDSADAFKFGGNLFPNTPNLFPPFGLAGGNDYSVFADNGSDHTRNIKANFDPINDRKFWSIVTTFNWRVNDNFTVKNIGMYRESKIYLYQDADLTSVFDRIDINGVRSQGNNLRYNTEEASEELQLQYKGELWGKPLESIAGFYFFHEHRYTDTRFTSVPLSGITVGQGEPRLKFLDYAETSSYSGFWNVRYAIFPQITLKAGGRYTRDDKWHMADDQLYAAFGAGPLIHFPIFNKSKSFSDYTNEAGLEWRPDFAQNMMFYYTFSQGFKAGASPTVTLDNAFLKPEKIDNNEFGVKSQWFNNRLTVNVAGYFYTINDVQFVLLVPDPNGGIGADYANVTTQEANGVEVDLAAAATENLRFGGSVAYTNAHLSTFYSVAQLDPVQVTNPAAAVAQDFSGNRPRQTPKWAANVHGEYDIPFLDIPGTLTLYADVSYKGSRYFEETDEPILSGKPFTMVDAKLKYTSPNEHWTCALWGKNIGNKFAVSNKAALFGVTGGVVQTLFPPRTWGVTVSAKF